jgi:hypothetical protein
MRVQRVWRLVGADPHHAEIEQLHRELTAFNERIAELEKNHAERMTMEILKQARSCWRGRLMKCVARLSPRNSRRKPAGSYRT